MSICLVSLATCFPETQQNILVRLWDMTKVKVLLSLRNMHKDFRLSTMNKPELVFIFSV